jgi:oligoendopeptidase F
VFGEGEAGVDRLLDEARERADAFAAAHAGKVAELDGAGLRDVMTELVALEELVARAGNYAALRFAIDTADPPRGALLQRVQERATAIETTLLFFELEWAALDEDRAEELLATEGLDFCRHHLRMQRRYRPHLLSEPEEKVMSEKSVTGSSAWARLFAEVTSGIRVRGEGDEDDVALEIALSRLMSPDREVRRSSAEGGHRGA